MLQISEVQADIGAKKQKLTHSQILATLLVVLS